MSIEDQDTPILDERTGRTVPLLTDKEITEINDRIKDLQAEEEDIDAQIKALEDKRSPVRMKKSRERDKLQNNRELADPMICEEHGALVRSEGALYHVDGNGKSNGRTGSCRGITLGRIGSFDFDWLKEYREVKRKQRR